MLDNFLWRNVFENLKCCLDLWLSSMFDCIHFSVFLIKKKKKKTVFEQSRQLLDTFRQLGYLSSLLIFLS